MSDLKTYIVKADMQCDIGKHLNAKHGHDLNGTVYDARLAGSVQWGWLCSNCFQKYGSGLGTGRGQKYERTPPSERWVLTDGSSLATAPTGAQS
jgi:hypothetical protein